MAKTFKKASIAEMEKLDTKSEMEWITHTQSLRMPYVPQGIVFSSILHFWKSDGEVSKMLKVV